MDDYIEAREREHHWHNQMAASKRSNQSGLVTTETMMREIGARKERERIRTELIDWLVGTILPCDAGLVNGRRIVDEIDRICPPPD